MKPLSTIFLLLISINTAHAEEGIIKKLIEYDVEIIIFEDAHARYLSSEDWALYPSITEPAEDSTESRNDTSKTRSNKINQAAFQDITPELLSTEYKRINHSSEYNVLFYGGWRQPGLATDTAFEIDIEKLKNNHEISSVNTLTGTFKLILTRYLHIYGEMKYQRALTASENTGQKNDSIPISIHRKMRSKELHYIDHPLVGMLIQINPVKIRTDESAE